MPEAVLAIVVLWTLNQIEADSRPTNLLRRLGMLWVALCIFRLFARIMG